MNTEQRRSKWWLPKFSIKDLLFVTTICGLVTVHFTERARTDQLVAQYNRMSPLVNRATLAMSKAQAAEDQANSVARKVDRLEERGDKAVFWVRELVKKHLAMEHPDHLAEYRLWMNISRTMDPGQPLNNVSSLLPEFQQQMVEVDAAIGPTHRVFQQRWQKTIFQLMQEISAAEAQEAVDAFLAAGNSSQRAAKALGIDDETYHERIAVAKHLLLMRYSVDGVPGAQERAQRQQRAARKVSKEMQHRYWLGPLVHPL